MSYRMVRTFSRIAKLGEKAVAHSNCAQNRNILFKCPRWSMLDSDTKRRIDTARDILVGKVPDPKSQVEQITFVYSEARPPSW